MDRFLERLPLGAVHVRDGRLSMNAASERLIGYSRYEVTTLRKWFVVLYGDVSGLFQAKYEAQRLKGFPDPKRGRIRRGDGKERLLEFRACTDVAGEVWIVDDITERAASEAELLSAKRAAEASNLAKGEFLANMSHEIRTPLNGVLAMAQMMALGDLQPDQRTKLAVIQQSGQDLLLIINDILDFSKIEAGKLELESVHFDPWDVISSVLVPLAVDAERKNLKLELNITADARRLRQGDPARFRQIVNNFVANAVKFTETGSVDVSLQGAGKDGCAGLTIAVRDTGVGIAPEKLPLLFQKFTQLDSSTTRQFGGTGLGLAVCRELAILMGGHVWAESELGKGSTFYATLKLPYASGDNPQAEKVKVDEDRHTVLPGRILAAEDNATNQRVLLTIMASLGLEVTLVCNGREAVEAWSAGGFDLILMDVQMPEMDGVEATRTIRKAEAERNIQRTPIIALSANAFKHQIEDYIAAGMDGHVAKPIDVSALHRELGRAIATVDAERLAANDVGSSHP